MNDFISAGIMTVILLSLIFASVLSSISLYNLFTAPRLKNTRDLNDKEKKPLVSVLIPARNEEKNIRRCIESVLVQSYCDLEIIVLNDNSTDGTREILDEFKELPRLSVLQGEELPGSWTGKNWACHQLSLKANGKLMLFLDADVELKSFALENAVSLFFENRLEMLSCFPTQKIVTAGEALVVPLMNWFLLSFLPLDRVLRSPRPALSAANGQFILISDKAYRASGGHETYKYERVEDMALIRKLKSMGERTMTVLGNDAVFCRMYSGFSEAFMGFEKNFYPGSGIPSGIFLTLLFITALSFTPHTFHMKGFDSGPVAMLPFILILLNRTSISLLSRQNILLNLLLHPLQMIVFLLLGISSVYKTKKRMITWKGRPL